MTEPRDTLVGEALRQLDVPEHAPGFWDRLEADLAAAPAPGIRSVDVGDPADLGAVAEVVELGAVRAARRTRTGGSRRVPAIAAAAAAVALAVAVGLPAAQQAADGESQVDSASSPTDPEPSTPVTSEPVVTAPSVAVQPGQVAAEWLELLRQGRHEEAYTMLDESSQAALPLDTFLGLASGLSEGAANFAGLDATTVPLIDDEGLAATAVVFTGDVEREGMVETASYPVIVTGDPSDPDRELRIGFAIDGPRLEAVQRTTPSETRTSPLELDLSPTAGATWAIIDGSAPERIDTGEATVSLDVEAAAGPGTHTVTVVSTEAGLYTARSFTLVVP